MLPALHRGCVLHLLCLTHCAGHALLAILCSATSADDLVTYAMQRLQAMLSNVQGVVCRGYAVRISAPVLLGRVLYDMQWLYFVAACAKDRTAALQRSSTFCESCAVMLPCA